MKTKQLWSISIELENLQCDGTWFGPLYASGGVSKLQATGHHITPANSPAHIFINITALCNKNAEGNGSTILSEWRQWK
jgi:hypothetical protein